MSENTIVKSDNRRWSDKELEGLEKKLDDFIYRVDTRLDNIELRMNKLSSSTSSLVTLLSEGKVLKKWSKAIVQLLLWCSAAYGAIKMFFK